MYWMSVYKYVCCGCISLHDLASGEPLLVDRPFLSEKTQIPVLILSSRFESSCALCVPRYLHDLLSFYQLTGGLH